MPLARVQSPLTFKAPHSRTIGFGATLTLNHLQPSQHDKVLQTIQTTLGLSRKAVVGDNPFEVQKNGRHQGTLIVTQAGDTLTLATRFAPYDRPQPRSYYQKQCRDQAVHIPLSRSLAQALKPTDGSDRNVLPLKFESEAGYDDVPPVETTSGQDRDANPFDTDPPTSPHAPHDSARRVSPDTPPKAEGSPAKATLAPQLTATASTGTGVNILERFLPGPSGQWFFGGPLRGLVTQLFEQGRNPFGLGWLPRIVGRFLKTPE
ncbi:MAG: hypothetical protein KC474_06170 [Cyanobacteria bacterium HKST-UBA04]|nr:hypothetical protein [Cyanobacteria bacterium HKST-UBA04]